MKKLFIFRASVVMFISFALLTGCSKDEIDNTVEETTVEGFAIVNRIDATENPTSVATPGLITGKIEPTPVRARLTLLDGQDNRVVTLYANRSTGDFRIGNVAPGAYKLQIEFLGLVDESGNQTVLDVKIVEVSVKEGETTNIGSVTQ